MEDPSCCYCSIAPNAPRRSYETQKRCQREIDFAVESDGPVAQDDADGKLLFFLLFNKDVFASPWREVKHTVTHACHYHLLYWTRPAVDPNGYPSLSKSHGVQRTTVQVSSIRRT